MTSSHNDILWHIYPLGFAGATIHDPTPDRVGDFFTRIDPWLDYARDLGVTTIQLGPIFAASTHGYDTLDHFTIDPRLGTNDDFASFVAACASRELKIVLDGVFNHLSRDHHIVRAAQQEGYRGEHAEWIRLAWDHDGNPHPYTFEGHSGLVTLNHESERVRQYSVDALCHWLERGIDGWRLDAAYAVPESFWANVLPRVRQHYPAAQFIGEVIHGEYAAIVNRSTLDTVTQYELWKAIWSSLKDDNFFELQWTLDRHNTLLNTMTPHTFISNHDVTRIASQVGQDKAVLAAAILMTVGGSPSIYYGDEQGFTGVKEQRSGGDDAVRPAFPTTPEDLSPLGGWIHDVYRQLIEIRRERDWIPYARTATLELTTTRYRYRVDAPDGNDSLTVDLQVEPSISVSIVDHNGNEQFAWSSM